MDHDLILRIDQLRLRTIDCGNLSCKLVESEACSSLYAGEYCKVDVKQSPSGDQRRNPANQKCSKL